MQSFSELRRDIVSGDWVVIATGRAKRPDDFLKLKNPKLKQARKDCAFEFFGEETLASYALGDATPILKKGSERWWVKVIPNKYPAFSKGGCPVFYQNGPYEWTEGVGFHEIVVTKDHDRDMADMDEAEIALILRAFQERFIFMQGNECVRYISIFQNHGVQAGASIAHSHSQIIAIPVIPPDVGRSLEGSRNYFHRHKECVHCVIVHYELKAKERIVYENERFAAIAPFASKTAFEIRIFPKKHNARFEAIAPEDRLALADCLQKILRKLHKGLKDPDYNFFIHTAPVDKAEDYRHYHWHLEIVPKLAIWAGFEIGTGIEISVIAPEASAKFLNGINP